MWVFVHVYLCVDVCIPNYAYVSGCVPTSTLDLGLTRGKLDIFIYSDLEMQSEIMRG